MGTLLRLVLVVAAVACGGKGKPGSSGPSADLDLALDRSGQKHERGQNHGAGQNREEGEAGEMAHMPPPLARFHETLAPRWHAPHGPKRMTDTCAAIAEFRARAAAVAATPSPEGGDAAAWTAGQPQLTEAVTALETTCKANDAAAFEPAFERVHKAFHGLLEAAGGHHDEPDEHGKLGKDER
jgi:hypothetical protein